jgi:uncharacterized iron-regulated membrane protein
VFKLPTHETKTLVAVHGWSAVALGFLLYAVVLTGAVAVFAHEIGHWSVGRSEGNPVFAQALDAHVKAAMASVPEEYREEVFVAESPRGNLRVWAHAHRKRDNGPLEEFGILTEIDPQSGAVVSQREGWRTEVFGEEPALALERFLVDVHVQLHLPRPWGLLLTGILGLSMMVAAISGLLIHRHLLRDSFTLRRRKATLVSSRDEHSVAATWGLPFAFLLAFTGTFFSFALSLGLPMVTMVAFGGDQAKMRQVLTGAPAAVDTRPANTADLDSILYSARARTDAEVAWLSIQHYARKDSLVALRHEPGPHGLEPKTLVFNGASGEFKEEKPQIGVKPSVGSTVFSTIGPLHFGNFAGVISKSIWLALGFSSCFMIATGLSLWLKRRSDQPGWHWFSVATAVVIYGLPLCLAASAYGFLLFYPAPLTVRAPAVAFLICAALVSAYAAWVRDAQTLESRLMFWLGAALFLLPLTRLATGGPGWLAALETGAVDAITIDMVLAAGGLSCLWFAYRWMRRSDAQGAANVAARMSGTPLTSHGRAAR